MRRRTRVLLVAVTLVVAAVFGFVGAVLIATGTPWGHDKLRVFIVAQLASQLTRGASITIGSIDGGLRRAWTADSITITDSSGHEVLRIGRLSAGLTLPSLLRGDVRLGVITIDGLHARLVQSANGTWNVTGVFATANTPTAAGGPTRRVVADSVEVRRSSIELTMPDTGAALPPVRRLFDGIYAALGPTIIRPPDASGGGTALRALAMTIDNPPVRLVSAHGTLRWWRDSLLIDIPELRLPASVATVNGIVSWHAAEPTRVALDVRADSAAVSDIRWMSQLFPSEGFARARVAVRSAPQGAFQYAVTDFDLVAEASRVSGDFTITAGRRVEVRDLALTLQPLDLALVRNVFGDTILKPSWQGALTGRIGGRGGFLDSLLIDAVDVVFADARVPDAHSHLRATGALDVAGTATRLIGFAVHVDSLDVRTLGAVVRAADSLHGVLTGSLTLNGPTSNLRFHSMTLRHVDGVRTQSTVTGDGRIASDVRGRWLDARLELDTIALATLFRDTGSLPLRGLPSATLILAATGDTMSIDATLADAGARVHLVGATLLDSTRTQLEMTGTLSAVDPRAFLARRDVPAASMSGTITIAIDERPGTVDRRVALQLDSTSRIGESTLRAGALWLGVDAGGFHVDTADISASNWMVRARGRVASDSAGSDTLTFVASFDSLAVLRSILLDSTGAPRFADIEGAVRADSGIIVGSYASASLRAIVNGADIRTGTTSAGILSGTIDLRDLPHRATGTVRGTVISLVSGAVTVDTASASAVLDHGDRARVAFRASAGDRMDARGTADVTLPDSLFVVRVDSLSAQVRGHAWRLAAPTTVRQRESGFGVDSVVMRSDHGASIFAGGTLPDTGPIDARALVRGLGFDEIAFLNLFPADMSGTINGSLTVTGTRDAPTVALAASLDSIRSAEQTRPSVVVTANYADRKASVVLGATIGGKSVLDVRGEVPLDLTLRPVEDRIIDLPLSLRLAADNLSLGSFESLLPRVQGLAGTVQGNVDVGGTLRRPRGRGTLTLANGSFDLPRWGMAGRAAAGEMELAGDSIIIRRLRMNDTDSPRDTAALNGIITLSGTSWSDWIVNLNSDANGFRVIDDPRLASAEADWRLAVAGTLGAPRVTGWVELPYAVFTIGPRGRPRRPPSDSTGAVQVGIPIVNGVLVTLGSDVRLRSRDANVQLSGTVELFGPLNRPWASGSVYATRGTYRVDLGVIKRTFRVDSGTVIVEGTPDISPALDIYASYTVRRPNNDDIQIGAHVYGTTDRPRLDLSSDLGTAVGQSEIISYLVFGQSSFGVPDSRGSLGQTATAALVPSLGGFLEGTLGAVLPFFSSLQVSTVAGEQSQNIISSPIDGLFNNNYAVTGGRQLGTDTFFSLTAGKCSAGGQGASSSSPIWFGTAAEYRPRRTVGAAITIDPGPAPCSRVSGSGDTYQIGFDLSYDWKFRRKP